MNYVQPVSGLFFTDANLAAQTGLSPDEDPTVLALNGIYELIATPDPYDPALYESTAVYTIVGTTAEQSWVASPLPLPTAKENGSAEAKTNADNEVAAIVTASGFSNEVLTAATSQVSPPTVYQDVLDSMAVVTDQLATNLAAIDAATTVDDINNIVNPPTGTLNLGRGAFGNPLDLNPSWMVIWNSVSIDLTDTELYAPATMTAMPFYGTPGVAPNYDDPGSVFTPGNYTIQLRQSSTAAILAEFECPATGPENLDFNF